MNDVVRVPDRLFGGYVFDLDGTIYLGDDLLPGAAETVGAVRDAGARVAFLTNNPLELPAAYGRKLRRLGIEADEREVVSSTDALLRYLHLHASGARLFPVSEPLVAELLANAGFELTEDAASVDVVVVAFDRTFDYAKLLAAFRAVRAGARIVATNPDPFCPTPDGGLPDCAAMLAAIEAATGERAEAIVGKPSPHMAATLLDRLGVPPSQTLLVGDRLMTDMRMAREAGMISALVLSGATSIEDVRASHEQPDFVIERLSDLVPELARRVALPPTALHRGGTVG